MAKLKSGTRIYGTATIDTSVVVGSAVTLSSSGLQVTGISTLNNANATQLSVTGISTFTNGPVFIGAATSTGTASQPLQVTGGAYVSGNLGIAITNPLGRLQIGTGTTTFIVTSVGSTALVGIGTTNPQYIFTVTDTGTPATTGLTNCLADFTTTANSYGQINLRNTSTGTNASSDIVITADNGTDSSNFIDLGINNSGFSVGSWTINGAVDGYLYTSNTNLSIGVAAANKYLSFFTDGTLISNERMRVNAIGVGIGTTNPTSTLTVTGSGTTTTQLYVSGVGTFQSSNLKIVGASTSFQYSIVGSAIAANRNLTIPLLGADDTFAFTGATQTFSGTNTFSGSVSITGSNVTINPTNATGNFTLGNTAGTGTFIVGQSTASQTTNIQAGASGVGTTKTINLGTGGLSGSFTQINIGPGPSAGVGTVVINSGTNLGIGSTTPTVALDVIGSAKFTGVSTFSNTTDSTSSTTGALIVSGGVGVAKNLFVGAGLSVTGVSTFSSNLGIGTTNPTSRLHVAGDTLVTGVVTASSFSGNASSATYATSAGIATYATTAGVSTNVIGGIGSITQLSVSGVSTTSTLNVGTGGTVITTTSSGNIGIGTTNPSHTLHVQGNARVTGEFRDSTNSPGTSGQVLQSTVTGTQWTTAAAGGGSGKFDTSIDNVVYVQPTGTLDIVGVGTTTTQITTLPSGSNEYIIHSIHVTNISNGDAEITAGFVMNARKVPATISVSIGQSGGSGIHTFTVGSASSITVGMAVTGTGNIGETTGIGSTAGFQYNTYVTSVDGTNITLSKPMSGRATGILYFSPVSLVSSRLPVPVGSAVELLKQPMVLNALDSIVLQSTGAGSGIGSTSTFQLHQTANVGFLTVTAGAAITNFLASGMLVQGTGTNTGIQTNTFVGVGYTPGSLSIPITRPATTSLASTSYTFTEVVVPQDGALQATIVYQSTTDTSYQNGTGTVVGIVTLASQATSPLLGITSTTPLCYYGTGNTYPSTVQSIRVSNISDGSIYPGGDYPVWVGIGNSDTVFSWLAYNMVIPKNSSIELCEAPKRLGIGQSIFAYSNTPGVIEIQVAAKQKTS